MYPKKGGPGPNATSHFEGEEAKQAKKLYKGLTSAGVEDLPKGTKVGFSRRGSVVVLTKDTVDVLHSVRTSAELNNLDHPPVESRRGRKTGMKRDVREEIFKDVRTHTGHLLEVESYEWVPGTGFREFSTREKTGIYRSGKAKGASFSDQKKVEEKVRGSGWLGEDKKASYSAENHNHSETDFHLQNPDLMKRSMVLDAHRMHGTNDICEHCNEGFQRTLLGPDQSRVMSYASDQPFGSQGEWNRSGPVLSKVENKLVRVRPEEMQTSNMHEEYLKHAKALRNLSPMEELAETLLEEPKPKVFSKKRANSFARIPKPSMKTVLKTVEEVPEEHEESIADRIIKRRKNELP